MWLSFYLYPDRGYEREWWDLLNSSILALKNTSRAKRFFFIRYKDSRGFHFRIRIAVERTSDSRRIIREAQSLWMCRDLIPISRDGRRCFKQGVKRVRIVGYRAELYRYGGYRLLPISESFFCASSNWVLRNHGLAGDKSNSRLIVSAMCVALVVAIAWPSIDGYSRFIHTMAEGLINGLEKKVADGKIIRPAIDFQWRASESDWGKCFAVAQKIIAGSVIDERFSKFTRLLRRHIITLDNSMRSERASVRTRTRIIFGWIHMHNNRLGITNAEEALIAYALRGWWASERNTVPKQNDKYQDI